MNYEQFVQNKAFTIDSHGFSVNKNELNAKAFEFQKDIVRWALAKGRAAIFADCGLGKTEMQLDWGRLVAERTGKPILIVAPLTVSFQTQREGDKFGIPVTICASQNDVRPGVNITNYEKLQKFEANAFAGVVLDESSILKSFTGKLRNQIIESFRNTPYKLACTATPAPNDYMELGNHSEFLGVMTRAEMLAMYFVHDGGSTSKWRLKGHAQDLFWHWMASWSVFVDNPSNIGYDVQGYDLPPKNLFEIVVDGNEPSQDALSLTERRQARRDSLESRCAKAAELVNNSDEQWLVWCDLNAEGNMLTDKIIDAKQIKGSDKEDYRAKTMLNFSNGNLKCLVSKASITGYGINWQQCHNMIYVGLSDSFESYYQSMRRCWRFGQTHPVNVYIIISAKEGCVRENIMRKQLDAEHMSKVMIDYTKEITKENLKKTERITTPYTANKIMNTPNWEEFA